MQQIFRFLLHLQVPAVWACAAVTAGCGSTAAERPSTEAATKSESQAEAKFDGAPAATHQSVLVGRYGRYRLIELRPDATQQDLMQQVIDVTIPASIEATVGNAMRHVLLRTGYRLCDAPGAERLYALPLPAAHLRLGPLALRDALATMAGPAWALVIDDFSRQVCFQPKANLALPNASAVEPISSSEARP